MCVVGSPTKLSAQLQLAASRVARMALLARIKGHAARQCCEALHAAQCRVLLWPCHLSCWFRRLAIAYRRGVHHLVPNTLFFQVGSEQPYGVAWYSSQYTALCCIQLPVSCIHMHVYCCRCVLLGVAHSVWWYCCFQGHQLALLSLFAWCTGTCPRHLYAACTQVTSGRCGLIGRLEVSASRTGLCLFSVQQRRQGVLGFLKIANTVLTPPWLGDGWLLVC
jgi:hypothetical protein